MLCYRNIQRSSGSMIRAFFVIVQNVLHKVYIIFLDIDSAPLLLLVGEAHLPPINICYEHNICHSDQVFLDLQYAYFNNFFICFCWFLIHVYSVKLVGKCLLCLHDILVVLFFYTLIIQLQIFVVLLSLSVQFC